MFRNSLRRCAYSARSGASASLLSQTRAVLPIANRRIAPVISSISPLHRLASIPRAYTTEASSAAASQPEASADASPKQGAPQEEVVRFADLDGVHPNLIKAITQGMGYATMTPVQAKTIQPALKGTDIVAQAKTGTGKTLAFLLPLLQRMINEDPTLADRNAKRRARSDDIRGIVLSPTRELAEQIAEEASRLVKNTGLVVQAAVGGTDKRFMLNKTRREGCHLLVATPGRLNDLLQDPRSNIEAPNLAALVLDEADRMLDAGFEKELNNIIEYLPSVNEKTRQTMLVSATIPDTVIRLARTMVRADDFEFVQTIPENESLTHDKVPQAIVPVLSWTNAFPTLFELIDREVTEAKEDPNARPFKAIVYFNTTTLVELAGELAYERRRNLGRDPRNLPIFVMQSKLTQSQRQKAADMFRQTKHGILFSSDVTARGMDFPNVTHVIQIDHPRDRESYIHRLGRTGRQGKEGEGWIIIPHCSVATARRMLKGLPIKQDSSLKSADVDIISGDSTASHKELKELFGAMPRRLLASTYTSMFGTPADKIAVAQDLNDWAVHGWGWEGPPTVSQKWVSLMGLNRAPGMNIDERNRDRDDYNNRGDRRGFGSDSPRGGFGEGRSGGGRSGYGNRSRDPFDAMRSNAVRDDHRGNSGSRFGRRGRDDRGSSF